MLLHTYFIDVSYAKNMAQRINKKIKFNSIKLHYIKSLNLKKKLWDFFLAINFRKIKSYSQQSEK
jgi:hypothetical protein